MEEESDRLLFGQRGAFRESGSGDRCSILEDSGSQPLNEGSESWSEEEKLTSTLK